jgi:hypothetical protein
MDIVKAEEYDYPFWEREVESGGGTLKRDHARSAAPFSNNRLKVFAFWINYEV